MPLTNGSASGGEVVLKFIYCVLQQSACYTEGTCFTKAGLCFYQTGLVVRTGSGVEEHQ